MRASLSIANIFRMKSPTGFTYRNLHGFARFPGDSTALVLVQIVFFCVFRATDAEYRRHGDTDLHSIRNLRLSYSHCHNVFPAFRLGRRRKYSATKKKKKNKKQTTTDGTVSSGRQYHLTSYLAQMFRSRRPFGDGPRRRFPFCRFPSRRFRLLNPKAITPNPNHTPDSNPKP